MADVEKIKQAYYIDPISNEKIPVHFIGGGFSTISEVAINKIISILKSYSEYDPLFNPDIKIDTITTEIEADGKFQLKGSCVRHGGYEIKITLN